MNKKLTYLFALYFLAIPIVSLAIAPPTFPPGTFNGTFITLANTLYDLVLNILWIIAAAFSIIMFIVAGFKFMTAQGEPSKVAEGRQAVIWGVVGVAVVVLAFSILAVVSKELKL